MTLLFVVPLMKAGRNVMGDFKTTRLHDVAQRTLVASVVCLFASLTNILVLAILGGRERGVVCLLCCNLDITLNVITIHWVTSNPAGKKSKDINTTSNPNETFNATFSVDHEKYKNKGEDEYGMARDRNLSNGRFVMVTPKEDDQGSDSSAQGSSTHKSAY